MSRMPSMSSVRGMAFRSLLRTPMRRWMLPSYIYQYSPAHLSFLVGLLTETEAVDGSIVEVGCFQGATTIFLNRHLYDLGSTKSYVAVDTFAGFLPEDVAVERRRGRVGYTYTGFRSNSIDEFRRTMRRNHIARVSAFQADAKTFDYAGRAPFSFCLVDVDLYEPVLATLEHVYDLVPPGGVIVVDDCSSEDRAFRGAYEAYTDFVATKGEPVDVQLGSLGVIRR